MSDFTFIHGTVCKLRDDSADALRKLYVKPDADLNKSEKAGLIALETRILTDAGAALRKAFRENGVSYPETLWRKIAEKLPPLSFVHAGQSSQGKPGAVLALIIASAVLAALSGSLFFVFPPAGIVHIAMIPVFVLSLLSCVFFVFKKLTGKASSAKAAEAKNVAALNRWYDGLENITLSALKGEF